MVLMPSRVDPRRATPGRSPRVRFERRTSVNVLRRSGRSFQPPLTFGHHGVVIPIRRTGEFRRRGEFASAPFHSVGRTDPPIRSRKTRLFLAAPQLAELSDDAAAPLPSSGGGLSASTHVASVLGGREAKPHTGTFKPHKRGASTAAHAEGADTHLGTKSGLPGLCPQCGVIT
eukprot:70266-Prorocentrum_minimum.AAC.2